MPAGTEIAMLNCLARASLWQHERQLLGELLAGPVDWRLFDELAVHHRVSPLVARRLLDFGEGALPPAVSRYYVDLLRQATIKSLLFTRSLLQVLESFREKGIAIIPFKGPVAAAQLFADSALRTYGDLDFLIDARDVEVVVDGLQVLGYQPTFTISRSSLAAFTLVDDSLSLVAEKRPAIDLHWELSGRSLSRPFNLALVFPLLRSALLEGRPVPVFSPEDGLIHYCLHGTKHNWEQYELVVCVGRQIEAHEIDWDFVIRRVSDLRCRRMFYVGLLLAQRLYGTEVPAEVLSAAGRDRRIGTLAADFEAALGESVVNVRLYDPRFRFFRFQVKDNVLEAARYALRLFFSPTVSEWKLFPVSHPPLVLLYWLIRPFRIFWTVVVGTIQRRWQ